MEKLENVLTRWRQTEPHRVPLGRLKTDSAYQPRNPRLVPYKDSARWKADADAHIARLAAHLAYGELDPLLVADIDGKLMIVDGHHRLLAHRRAGKCDALAHIMRLTTDEARMVSKLVNCDPGKLKMHDEQRRECAWQYLAYVTTQGRTGLPACASRRRLAQRFGVGREAIRGMLKRLPEVNLAEYGEAACDPGTGFPNWKHVKGNAIRDRFADVDDDMRTQRQDERRAAKLAAIIDKDGSEAFLRSLRLLEHEALADAAAAHLEALEGAGDDP